MGKVYSILFKKYPVFIVLLAILVSGSLSVHAQCGGGYGPSLFMETFGNGTTLGPALTVDHGTGTDYTRGATAYTFDNPAGNLQDNHYTICTSPKIAKWNWVDIPDHTGDVNGKMLVVNASYAPDVFYKRKVSNLCFNTNFKFSAFLVEVNGPGSFSICGGAPLPANVRFEVQDTLGNILSSVATGNIAAQNIPNPQWKGYTFSFNTGNYSTINVVLRNINPGGCGNDLAIDDISVQACGPSINFVGPSGPVCLNNSITFQATPNAGYPTPFFQWQQSIDAGKTWADISGANYSAYSIARVQMYQNNFQFRCRIAGSVNNIKNDNCTIASPSVTLVIQTQPLTFTPPPSICRNGGLVNLVPYGNPTGGQFSGTGVTGNTFDPSALIHTSDTLYYTYQGSITKCTTTDTAIVLILSSPITKITANGPAAMCAGMKVQLSIAGTAAIQWYLNGIAIQGATGSVYYAAQTGNYKVVQTNSLGCSSSDQLQVTIYPVPALFMDGGTATLCQGSSATITGPVSANSYKWTYGHKITLPGTGNTLVTQTGGLYTLTIVDKNSCTDSADYHIAINDVPVPVVQESLDSIICQGDSTTFGVFNSFVTYQWYRSATGIPGSYTAVSGASNTNFAAHTSGFYYISVTNIYGCAGISAPHQVIVMDPPGKAHVTASTSVPVCYPGGVTVSTGAIPGLSYQWKWNGAAQPNSNSFSYIARYSGWYSVIERNSTGCFTLSDSVQVIVNPKPQAYTPTGNLQSCGGAPTVLSAFIQPGYSYAWYLNNSLIAGQSASTLSAVVSGSYFYIVTNATGCKDTSLAVSVKVFPKVTPQILLDGPSVLCASDSTTMEVTATFPSYQWFENGNPIPKGTNHTLRVSTVGTNQYTVQIKDLNGCSGISAPMQILVNKLPAPVLQPSTATEFCSGNHVDLAIVNNPGFTNIIWKLNGTQIQGVTGATYTVTKSGNYTITVTNSNGCTGSSPALQVLVDPTPAPILNVTGPVVLCPGKASAFTLNTTNSVPGGTYTWYQTDSLNPLGVSHQVISGIDYSSYTLAKKGAAGYYSVKVTSPGGCTGYSDTAFISLYQPPVMNLGKQIICSGDFTTLESPPGYNFQWAYSIDGSTAYTPAPGSNNLNTYKATTPGFYQVSLQDKPSGGCPGSAIIQVKTNVPLVVTITGSASSCPGVPVVLSSLISNAHPPSNPTYQWSFMPAGSATYHTISGGVFSSIGVDSSGSYKVLVSARNFCPDSAIFAYSNFYVVKALILKKASICAGNSVTLVNTGPALPAGDTYQWYRNYQPLAAPGGTAPNLSVTADGYYFLQLKDPNGCFSNSDTSYVTVEPVPQPSINLSGPTVVCAGSPVKLYVSSQTNFSYHWTYSATIAGSFKNLTPDITDTVLNVTANTGYYMITETSTSGCSASASIYVVIDTIPLLHLPLLASICPGSALKLKAVTNAHLTWFYKPLSRSTPVIISIADSVLANLAGIYSVQARNPGDPRCFSTDSTVVSVNPVPVARFNARDSCRQSSTMIFINSTTLEGGPAPTYKWNFGDPLSGSLNTSVAVNGAHLYTAIGRYQVTLIATSVNGCADTLRSAYTFKGTRPVARFSISGNPAKLCGGQPIALNDLSTTASGTIVSYRWDIFTASGSVAPVSAGNIQNPVLQFPDTIAQVSYRIRESVTSTSGCIDTASQVITIGAAPMVSLHLAQKRICLFPGTDTLAGGMPLTGGTGSYSGKGIVNGVFNAKTLGPGKYPVLFTFTDALSGCSASAIDTLQVMPLPAPTTIAITGIITPCTKAVNLKAANSTALNFTWMRNDTLIANASAPVYTATRSGTYTAMAFTAAGCERDTSVLLSIANGPRAAFVVGAVCQNLIVNFVNLSSTGDRSALTYKWDFGDPGSPANTSTVLNPRHQYMSAGKPLVTLMVSSASGCVDTLAMPVVVSAVDSNANFRIGSNTPYCIHEPLVFQDSSLLPGQLINKYVWNFYDQTGKLIRRDSGATVFETFGADLKVPAVYTVQETLSTGLNCPVLSPVKSFTINPLTSVAYIPEAARDMCSYAPGFSLTGGSTVPAGAAGKGYYTGSGVIDSNTFMPSKAQPGLNAVSYVFNNKYGCSSSAVVQYKVHDTIPLAGQRIETMEGTVITLMGTGALPFTFGPDGITSISADSLKWNWSPGTGLTGISVPNPYFTASDSINYTLTLTSPFGCISRAVFRIIVHKLIHVPNAFTPNGDGTNDYWVIRGLDLYPNADVFIFNRYGQQLFHSKGYGKPWNGQYNGRSLPMGTYYYLIQLNGQNGISGKTQQTITGPLTLLY